MRLEVAVLAGTGVAHRIGIGTAVGVRFLHLAGSTTALEVADARGTTTEHVYWAGRLYHLGMRG